MVLVTGSTGLVGSYLLYYLLEKGKQVRAMKRKTSSVVAVKNVFKELNPKKAEIYFDSIQWIEGEINDLFFIEDAVKGCEEIYHCLALITFDETYQNELFRVNCNFTKLLVDLSIEHKIKKFCYFSSIATLGKSLKNQTIDEETTFDLKSNLSSYARSKYAAEMEVFRASQEGLSVVVVNPGVIIGSHHWTRKLSMMFELNKRKFAFSSSGISHLVDVRDVAKCSIELMEKNIFNQKFILVSDGISYKNQNDIFRKIYNKNPTILVSKFLVKLLYYLTLPFKFISKTRKELSRYTFNALFSTDKISNKKIRKTLNYTFISAEESIEYHAKNYLKYINK